MGNGTDRFGWNCYDEFLPVAQTRGGLYTGKCFSQRQYFRATPANNGHIPRLAGLPTISTGRTDRFRRACLSRTENKVLYL